MDEFFRKNLFKFSENQGERAKSFQEGAEAALREVLTTGDDQYWTELILRPDGNGNLSWYVDLYSCPQGKFPTR
jgi:hypothetical protein